MKKIIFILTIFAIFAACSDEFDINRDPDNLDPNGIALKSQFPAGIVGVAGAQGAYYALIGGFWSQFWSQSNASNQYKEIDNYSIGTNDYNGGWAAMYDALGDIRNVKRLALQRENWNYYLMTTVLEAHAAQIMVDLYDQIPFSEANNPNITQPAFQSGQEVYDILIANLQDALAKNLNESSNEIPGSDDFLFNGNMDNWTGFANSLLLKLYLRQTEVRPTVAQEGIEALLSSGASFLNTDAALTQFEDAPDRSNPLFETDRRQLNTKTNLRASLTLHSYLADNSDPRLEDFFNTGNPMNQGDFNSLVAPTSFAVVNLSPLTPVYFMSREESLLLQAEALERYSGGNGAQAKYDAAVVEAMSKWNHDGTSFVASGGAYEYPSSGTFQDKLQSIITQKWISSFPGNGFESFFEQNRTGIPAVSSVGHTDAAYVSGELSYAINGTTGGLFPKRLEFPSTVRTRNQNCPAIVGVTVPVWWDVN